MVTTTHDPSQGGNPRLIFAVGGTALVTPGQSVDPEEFPLAAEVTVLGSDPEADLHLSDIDPHQADIVHDEFDEYVFVQTSVTVPSQVNGVAVERHTLRTGDRLEIGPWTLTFFREEYADHGRPFGGRQGGEGAVQEPQPSRSEVSGAADPGPEDLRTVLADPPAR